MPAPATKKVWSFEEIDPPDWLLNRVPDRHSLRFFYVKSGDSGKKYMIQILTKAGGKTIPQCQCTDGFMRSALLPIRAIEPCKHATYLLTELNLFV